VPLLARHFVEHTCGELGGKTLNLHERALAALTAHAWPGNVRELQNALERAVILAEGDTILPGHLNLSSHAVPAAPAADPWDSINLDGSLAEATTRVVAEAERRKIQRAVRDAGGDKGRAADLLQVGYRALLVKMKELGLETDATVR
jgi:two-component system, NtrC family, response regulator AtoC